MLRRKLQANRQLLLGGKGQWGQDGWTDMASAKWGRTTPPSRCSAQSALCFARDHLDSQRLQGKSEQAGL